MYQVHKEPLFFMFDKEKVIYPTIFLLWKVPDLMHTITTQPQVVERLTAGADLMLPGVVTTGPMNPKVYGMFDKGFPVSINTTSNQAPIAVGLTAQSSMDLFMAARQGKGVIILHVFGDHLWDHGARTKPPQLGPPDFIIKGLQTEDADEDLDDNEDEEDSDEGEEASEQLTDAMERLSTGELSDDDDEQEEEQAEQVEEQVQEISGKKGKKKKGVTLSLDEFLGNSNSEANSSVEIEGPEAMDALLLHCFLKALKLSANKIEIPILTSNFYRLHVVPGCPDGRTLDVKKSSYKKLSKFLNEMAKKQIIQVKEFPKGIENITAVNYEHEEIKYFRVDKKETSVKPVADTGKKIFIPPTIEELYQVSGETIGFFRSMGLSKGDVLTSQEIRVVVTDYIKKHNLQVQGQKMVNVDPLLHETVVNRKEGYKEQLRWDEIFSRMLGKMSMANRITKAGEVPIIKKGKLEPIELAVAKRSGNKRVTFVYNAGIYGIDENQFAHQVQLGVAASTSVGPAEHKPQGTTQILIQGNQINFVAKLLLETYNLPRKYIRGLELAPKGKGRGK